MDETAADYEPPTIVVLGTVAELTQAVNDGINPDLVDFTPSIG